MSKKQEIPIYYYPLELLLKGLSLLPLPVLYLLADLLYFIVYHIVGYRKKVVLNNLCSSFPEKSEAEIKTIAKAFYNQLTDVVVEILKLRSMNKEEMERRIVFANQELLDDFVKSGTPVITMGSHSCNWEWVLSAGAVQFDFPAEGVYKPLNNPYFEDFMLRTRSRLGARLIKMKDTLRDFAANRHVPRVIAMLSDQTPLRSEITFWTTFLNQDTPFYEGAEKLAKKFKYPVMFLDVKRTQRGFYTLTFELISDGTSDAVPITEIFAQKLEAAIRHAPANYLWTHKRWKHRRPEAAVS
ncbi:lysophospholipid acyltransferase family protein [Pontibacter sp. BT310]|uniref:Lysophospholipid acyltransferase family protein n=1 Tax=Pontibacter populi TaxID=890055 RepID=A0ABS6X6T3_9BACT|nr:MULTISPECIES: lysophospholipid acyltransferase family protein [Pontibacter]MBJ6116845.1 lysophospholipid acyltransferase family protein [Pontibacter sp. BT310]MBR0569267.1 lysophospholipid acyltransferase family protein [Microvirga sp. STS03]MBW3363698.1 lysophospholipid acyltransferase family protein [Pontibacter populi]